MKNNFRHYTINWFDTWKFYRPIFFTGVLNDKLGYGVRETHDRLIKKTNKHFLNELHRKAYTLSGEHVVNMVGFY